MQKFFCTKKPNNFLYLRFFCFIYGCNAFIKKSTFLFVLDNILLQDLSDENEMYGDLQNRISNLETAVSNINIIDAKSTIAIFHCTFTLSEFVKRLVWKSYIFSLVVEGF